MDTKGVQVTKKTKREINKMTKWKVGIVGYGIIGEEQARVWETIDKANLGGIAEINGERRAAAKQEHSCPTFETVEDMLQNRHFDIIHISTQAPLHHPQMLVALKRNCNVLCEKPITLTLKEADEVIELAEKKGLKIGVFHQHAFTQAAQKAEELILNGAIGDLYFVSGWAKGRLAPYELMEEGTHSLHLMQKIAGKAKFVLGHVTDKKREVDKLDVFEIALVHPKGRNAGFGAGNYAFGYYKFTNGVCGELRLATITSEDGRGTTRNREYMATEFFGTTGRLRFHHLPPGRLFYKETPLDDFDHLEWKEIETGYNEVRSYAREFKMISEDFILAIQDNRVPLVSGIDGRDALEAVLGIYASHLSKKRESLPLAIRTHPFGPNY